MIKILGTESYGKTELDIDSNVELIIRRGIGVDNIDLLECQNRNIPVVNIPDICCNAVAEFTVGQILLALRYRKDYSRELEECTVGIFGYGNIGRIVKQKLINLGVSGVLVNDIALNKPSTATKEQILFECDIISLHIPLKEPLPLPTYDNTNFIDKNDLALMKNDAIIVNMSRAGIINEVDLVNWLEVNPNATAVLDVLTRDIPFNIPNTILSHHQAGTTMSVKKDTATRIDYIINQFKNGKQLYNRVI